MVAHLSDDQLWRLRRGGHDYRKVYAAYKVATEVRDAPTVILAKTSRLGPRARVRGPPTPPTDQEDDRAGAAQLRRAPPGRDPCEEDLRRGAAFLPSGGALRRDPVPAGPAPGPSGAFVPERRVRPKLVTLPDRKVYDSFDSGTVERGQEVSTTMAFVRLLRDLMRDRELGPHVVPIIRTRAGRSGMESLFKDFKIYSPMGQRYDPVDANMLLSYTEARSGQILEEGITEAGSMASATAAGTAYATQGVQMVPFFLFYSMFGFQRVGDLIWAFGDARGRGFLLGCTAVVRRSTARGSSTRTASPTCWPPRFPTAVPTTPPSPTRRRRSPGRAAPHDRQAPDLWQTTSSTTHALQRELRHAGKPEGCERGDPGRDVPREACSRGAHPPAQLLGSGSILPTQVLRATGAARGGPRRRRRRLERDELQAAPGDGLDASAGTACTPPSRRGCRSSPVPSRGPRDRSSRRATG